MIDFDNREHKAFSGRQSRSGNNTDCAQALDSHRSLRDAPMYYVMGGTHTRYQTFLFTTKHGHRSALSLPLYKLLYSILCSTMALNNKSLGVRELELTDAL